MKIKIFLLALSCWMFIGCATLIRGPKEVLLIESKPSEAYVEIIPQFNTKKGPYCGKTPMSYNLIKRAEGYLVKITKDDYEPAEIMVHGKTDALGRMSGLIDIITGSHMVFIPNPISVNLKKTKTIDLMGTTATDVGVGSQIPIGVGVPDAPNLPEK